DNRLLSLWLVKHGLTKYTMFNPKGKSIHPSEFLYRKAVMVVRGSFRPPTLVNEDMIKTGYAQFRAEKDVNPAKSFLITELTLENLRRSAELDERDFLHRSRLLNALGQTVLVSNYQNHNELLDYLRNYKIPKLGIVLGVHQVLALINEKYNNNMDGRLLAAFGEIFTHNLKVYVYPAQQQGSADLMTIENLPIPEAVKFLYRHLRDSGQIEDIKNYNASILHIFSPEVLELIESGGTEWESMVPDRVAKLIREDCLFGFPSETLEFDY
ncbi:MAG: TonB-dependent receptor, partial [Bacteroidota bacterium]